MATLGLGSMVVQLDLDGADFIRTTGQARQALGQLPREIDRTTSSLHLNRTAIRLASQGISEMTGISGPLIFNLERMTETGLGAAGALGAIAKAGLVVGTGLAAFFVGQQLIAELRNLRDFGELTSSTTKRMEEETDAANKLTTAFQSATKSL